MNRFLSQDDNSNDLNVRTVTVDTSAVTNALTLRADALETSTAALLEYIRILQDVSYTLGFNAYTEAARLKIVSAMPYPSYVQISTVPLNGVSPSRILNASGVLVSVASATTHDVWQIVPTGGRSVTISSSSGVDLAQANGRSSLDIISSDGLTFHIGEPGTNEVYTGNFLTFTDGSTSLWNATYASTALLRATDRFSLSLVPNYIPLTATELTLQLFQRTFPTVTNGEYEFQLYSYEFPTFYVQQKALQHSTVGAYKHFLGIVESSASLISTYPVDTWKFVWDASSKKFCIKTYDTAEAADIYLGKLKQNDGDYLINTPAASSNWYQDNTRAYSDDYEVTRISSSTGETIFRLSQSGSSLKTITSNWPTIIKNHGT